MRFVFLAIFVLLVAAAVIFAFQNLEPVTVSFLGMTIHTRLAVLAIAVYVLGAVTGGSLLALLRQSYEGASEVITRRAP
jgi:lipopolysaccharide assembly protein A